MEFEITGGSPALDFANTVSTRKTEHIELLQTYADLLEWSIQAGVLRPARATALAKFAKQNPAKATRALKEATEMREMLFDMFVATTSAAVPKPETPTEFNKWIQRAARRKKFVSNKDGYAWTFGDDAQDLRAMLWPIIDHAAQILSDDALCERIRICEGHTCAWTFLDYSRRQNRRWCDMSVCGNRAKAQRHYAKSKSVSRA